jgi:hypothetical protein
MFDFWNLFSQHPVENLSNNHVQICLFCSSIYEAIRSHAVQIETKTSYHKKE